MTDSTILVKSPDGWKIKVAFGIFGLAVIVVLAFLYRVEVGIITLVLGLGVGARVGVWAWHQYNLADHQRNLAGYERRRLEAEVRKAEAEAEAAKARIYFVETNTGVFVLDGIAISQFYPALRVSQPFADGPALLPAPEPPVKRLLDIDFIHMLIRGPSGSGKTTIGNWLIDNARPGAAVYVLDPHASQNASKGLPWSARAEVVGDGRDWRAIDVQLQRLMEELDRRYKPGARFDEVLIVSDEWLAVLEHCPHAREFFETVGSEARKVDMRLVIMTVSATADDLKCTAPVRDNLVELRLDHGLKSRNQGELRWGRGSVETVELPGPYRAAFAPVARAVTEPMPVVEEAVEPLPILYPGPVAPAPTAKELRICELWDEGGRSQRAIYLEVYGKEPGGGRQLNEGVTEVLRRFGRIE